MALDAKTSLFLALFLLMEMTSGAVVFHCSDVNPHGCHCTDSYGDDYLITCPVGNQSSFLINIEPSQYVQVRCHKGSKLPDFYLNLTSREVPPARQMYIRYCDLPENESLAKVAEQVNAGSAEEMLYESVSSQGDRMKSHHLAGFPQLKKLILSCNGLTSLPADVFSDVPALTRLNLRENSLQHLPRGIFDNTPLLRDIELGMNQLESLEAGIFGNLSQLTLLNVWKNRLRRIEVGAFDGLSALRTIDLNSNLLENLTAQVFGKLDKLENISLFGNNFATLPVDLLKNCTMLKRVNLSYNRRNLTLPSGFFANFSVLEQLLLKRSGLSDLPGDVFRGSKALRNIDLQRNELKELPRDLFQGLKDLRVLNLAFNRLETLPDGIFADNQELEVLDLSRNRFTTVTRNFFIGLHSLKELSMNDNKLTTIQEQSFYLLKNLQIARFSNNKLTMETNLQDEFGKLSPFHKCTAMSQLYLDRNNISDIFVDWVITSLHLRKLDLRYNNIPYLVAEDLQFLSTDVEVNLSHNRISKILLSHAEVIAAGRDGHHRIKIRLDDNPLSCDCDVYDLLRHLEGKMSQRVREMFVLEAKNLRCASPADLKDLRVGDLSSSNFTCALTSQELKSECPEDCSCRFRPVDRANLVNCSHRNLTAPPTGLSNSQALRVELDLSGNQLTELPKFVSNNVVKLLLADNAISSVSVDALAPYNSTLEILELHDNNLTRMDSGVFDLLRNFSSLSHVTLHGNPWSCDCDSRDLLGFVQTTKLVDSAEKTRISCGENDEMSISETTLSEICPAQVETVVMVSLALALLGVVLGSLAALYYRYQREVKVWLYARQWCLWLVTEEELDRDKRYDAFVSYSHKDEAFIVGELMPRLENGPRPLKLCLHFRDWVAGEWIPTQIARSVEDSRRTVIVLSPNFLESVWGRMEFRAAHKQALSEGRARVIVILYGEIGPTDDLDPELKAYLSMNTYIKWGDPWFWDKLRYALPHPPELRKHSLGSRKRIFENQQPCIQLNGDKKGLVYPAGEPETPPASSTPPADSLKVFICDGSVKQENEMQKNGEVKDSGNKTNETNVVTPIKPILGKIHCTTV